nr:MAG TPA: hypothetical protein [Caudoviricetes sp.]
MPGELDSFTRSEKVVLEALAKLNEEQQKRLIKEAVADVLVGEG